MLSNFKYLVASFIKHQAYEQLGEDTVLYLSKVSVDVFGKSAESASQWIFSNFDDERTAIIAVLDQAEEIFLEELGQKGNNKLIVYAQNFPLCKTETLVITLNQNSDQFDLHNLYDLVKNLAKQSWVAASPEEIAWVCEAYCSAISRALAKVGRVEQASYVMLRQIFDALKRSESALPDRVAEKVVEALRSSTPQKPVDAFNTIAWQFSTETSTLEVSRQNFDINLNINEQDEVFGREREISHLYDVLDPDSDSHQRYVLLHGIAGIGKTAIARNVVSKVAPRSKTEPEKGRYDLVVWFSVNEFFREDRTRDALDGLLNRISERVGASIHRSTFGNSEIKMARLIDALKDWRILIVIDEFKRETQSDILKFIGKLPKSVSILAIRRSNIDPLSSTLNWRDVTLQGVSKESARSILHKFEPELKITDGEMESIYDRTNGNPKALKICAALIKQVGVDFALQLVIDDDDSALGWVGGSIKSLKSPYARAILRAFSVFESSAHRRAITAIAGIGLTKDQVDRAIEELIVRDLVHQVSEGRFVADRSAREYMRPKNESELEELRERWVNFYYQLRDRDADPEIGWTIMSDYEPDGPSQLAFKDELTPIAGVIDYCLSDSRCEKYWKKAAKIVDDFRQPFFAGRLWSRRIDHCKKILELADKHKDVGVEAQFRRLLAWVNCFRDCPPSATVDASVSREIALRYLKDSQLENETRVSLLQSLYKANNTLGQINLIQARSLVTEGHRYLRNSSMDLADVCFSRARPLFDSARQWFSDARELLVEHFPRELTSIDFHIAEVSYYDRNPVMNDEKQYRDTFTVSQLREAQLKFKQLLMLAYQRTPCPHQRLIAHCQYYLGKIARRLNSDVEAWERLIVAEEMARKYSDDVLLARIHFAQSQWHEAMRTRRSQLWLQDIHVDEAKRLLTISISSFQRLNMRIELIDAMSFGSRMPPN